MPTCQFLQAQSHNHAECHNQLIILKVENGHKSSSNILSDYCDGSSFESHPLYSKEKNSIQIYFYFDELEICNPLGSETKVHKLGM